MLSEYRIVSCGSCPWRAWYDTWRSYPPRCPDCGSELLDHEFSIWDRSLLSSIEPRRRINDDRGLTMIKPERRFAK